MPIRSIARSARAALAAAAIVLALPFAACADEEPFDETEKEAIEQIVRDYLVAHPEVMIEVMDALEAKERAREAAESREAIVSNREDLEHDGYSYVAGNPDGAVTIVEFFDYNCGYCRHMLPVMRELLDEHDDVRLVLKEWPALGESSEYASRAAIASMLQDKYMPFHFAMLGSKERLSEDKVMEIAESVGIDTERLKRDMKDAHIDEIQAENERLAFVIGAQGTPAFVIGDRFIGGAAPKSEIEEAIEEARTGCTSC